MTAPHNIEISCSRHFLAWLHREQISLAFTTYQTNRLFLLGLKGNGDLSTFERLLDRPMGLFANRDRLYVGCRYQIWQFDNSLPPHQQHDGYDALYVPRRSYTVGDVDVHDICVDENGRIFFINTLYSCLATISDQYSFQPLWHPPFISKLAPEDRCHLNGLALVDGGPRWATAVSRADVFAGWRKRREQGGLLIDIVSNDILLDTLSMPHSPRWHEGQLWLLNAGSGDLLRVDPSSGSVETVAFCPGFARGLTFHKQYAIVGLSKPRGVKAFRGLSLDEKLATKDADAICGLAIIDTTTGNIVHWVEVEGVVSELYDVAVLPNVVRPMALGFRNDEISRFITIDYPNKRPEFQPLQANPDANTTPIDFASMKTPRHTPSAPVYRFQLSFDMSVAAAIQGYAHLTFPPLQQLVRGRSFREPLITAVVRVDDEVIGMVLAEPLPDNKGAALISCFVATPHRQKGIATRLLQVLEKGLTSQGIAYLDFSYSTDWPTQAIIDHMLTKGGWQEPRTQHTIKQSEWRTNRKWLVTNR